MRGQLEAASKGIVAVVDDDPAVRHSLKFSLEVEGFSVRIYADAGEFLRDTGLAEFECIVTDQNMPRMTGLELVSQLRGRSIQVPAILITGHANSVLRRRAEEVGVAAVVEKPFLGNALLDKIRLVTGRQLEGDGHAT